MTLKGDWDKTEIYSVGDVVRYEGVMYHMQKPCKAGISPHDTLYWGRTGDQEVLSMMVDLFNGIAETAASIPDNLSDEAITLSTETADYLVTVDDSGDTPELTVTVIEEEGDS